MARIMYGQAWQDASRAYLVRERHEEASPQLLCQFYFNDALIVLTVMPEAADLHAHVGMFNQI